MVSREMADCTWSTADCGQVEVAGAEVKEGGITTIEDEGEMQLITVGSTDDARGRNMGFQRRKHVTVHDAGLSVRIR